MSAEDDHPQIVHMSVDATGSLHSCRACNRWQLPPRLSVTEVTFQAADRPFGFTPCGLTSAFPGAHGPGTFRVNIKVESADSPVGRAGITSAHTISAVNGVAVTDDQVLFEALVGNRVACETTFAIIFAGMDGERFATANRTHIPSSSSK